MSDKKINDGGPAFPVYATPESGACDKDVREASQHAPAFNIGMTLRDYFAAQVLQGMYAYSARADDGYDPGFDDSDFEEIAADDPHQPKYYKPKSRGYWVAFVNQIVPDDFGKPHKCVRTYEQRVARNAYKQADAMLAARSEALTPQHTRRCILSETRQTGDGPGEWTLANPPEMRRSLDGVVLVPILANKAPDGDQMPAQVYGSTPERRMARARLISAAPDLLAACEAVIGHGYCENKHSLCSQDYVSKSAIATLRAAIQKATGTT